MRSTTTSLDGAVAQRHRHAAVPLGERLGDRARPDLDRRRLARGDRGGRRVQRRSLGQRVVRPPRPSRGPGCAPPRRPRSRALGEGERAAAVCAEWPAPGEQHRAPPSQSSNARQVADDPVLERPLARRRDAAVAEQVRVPVGAGAVDHRVGVLDRAPGRSASVSSSLNGRSARSAEPISSCLSSPSRPIAAHARAERGCAIARAPRPAARAVRRPARRRSAVRAVGRREPSAAARAGRRSSPTA